MDAAALLEKAHEVLNARQVIGEPYEKNGTTLVPVVSLRGGGGGGGGGSGGDGAHGAASGGGGGMGLVARPVGAYVIRGDTVTWSPAVDVNRAILGVQMVAIVALMVARSVVRSRTKRAVSLANQQ